MYDDAIYSDDENIFGPNQVKITDMTDKSELNFFLNSFIFNIDKWKKAPDYNKLKKMKIRYYSD